MKPDEKKFITVIVAIIILFIIVARVRVLQTHTPEEIFNNAQVVVFKTPIDGENITSQTIQFLIEVAPTNMSGLYVKSWEFILAGEDFEKTILSNLYFHSTTPFTINEMLYLGSGGNYKAIVSLSCYYKNEHYVFNTTVQFNYIRT